nr:cytochrome P450 [Planosporangium mesophilum]
MHTYPEWHRRLAYADEAFVEAFGYELRRFYPFAPVLGARVRQEFVWLGRRFPRGRQVMLDVFGTDRDPEAWTDPDRFDPYRFVGRKPDKLAWIPHGDGDPATSHRCAGEGVTTELLKTAVRKLCQLRYDVPPQDLDAPLNRMPTRPRSGFVMANVQRVPVRAMAGSQVR